MGIKHQGKKWHDRLIISTTNNYPIDIENENMMLSIMIRSDALFNSQATYQEKDL